MLKRTLLLFFLTAFLFFGCSTSVFQSDSDTTEGIVEASLAEQEIEYPIFFEPEYDKSIASYRIEQVPNPKAANGNGYISDPGNVLTYGDEQRLNELAYDIESKSTAQLAIVVLPSIGDEVPKSFATQLFKKWGIGRSDTDNGLLILTIMDQRRTEFEVGNGLEPILTDVVCYRIGTNEIVPYFKKGEFGAGLVAAVRRVKEFLDDPASIDEIYSNDISYEDRETIDIPVVVWIYGIICLLLSIWFYGLAFDIELSKDDFYDKYKRLEDLKFGCMLFLFPIPFLFFNAMVKKRLKKYRYNPRFSKVNGKLLKLKNEWSENSFLEKAQIIEEDIRSARYDVWVTDDESDVMILEYEGLNARNYEDCKECGYKTFGRVKSTVVKSASYDYEGERLDRYECKNCNYREEKTVVISRISRPSESSSSSSSSSYSSSSSSSSSSSYGGGSSSGGGSGVSW